MENLWRGRRPPSQFCSVEERGGLARRCEPPGGSGGDRLQPWPSRCPPRYRPGEHKAFTSTAHQPHPHHTLSFLLFKFCFSSLEGLWKSFFHVFGEDHPVCLRRCCGPLVNSRCCSWFQWRWDVDGCVGSDGEERPTWRTNWLASSTVLEWMGTVTSHSEVWMTGRQSLGKVQLPHIFLWPYCLEYFATIIYHLWCFKVWP